MHLASAQVSNELVESEIGVGFLVITDKNQLGVCVLFGTCIGDELEIVLSFLQFEKSAETLFVDTLCVLYFGLIGCFDGFTVVRNYVKAGDYSLQVGANGMVVTQYIGIYPLINRQ